MQIYMYMSLRLRLILQEAGEDFTLEPSGFSFWAITVSLPLVMMNTNVFKILLILLERQRGLAPHDGP